MRPTSTLLPTCLLLLCGCGGATDALAHLVTAEFDPASINLLPGHLADVDLAVTGDKATILEEEDEQVAFVELDPDADLPASITATVTDAVRKTGASWVVNMDEEISDGALLRGHATVRLTASSDLVNEPLTLVVRVAIPHDNALASLEINGSEISAPH